MLSNFPPGCTAHDIPGNRPKDKDTKFKENQKVRDKISHEEGEIYQVYHDGWLLVKMEDGLMRHYEPYDIELITR